MNKGTAFYSLLIFVISTLHFSAQTCQHIKCLHKHHNLPKNSDTDNLRSDTVNVINYAIEMDFTQVGSQIISGECQVKFEALQNNVATLSLDLLQLTVDSIKQQGITNNYTYNDTLLIVNLHTVLSIGALDSVTVYYHGSPQGDPSNWGGFYFQGNYAYNLGVGFGADPHNYGRVWHPCFDNFVERATYDIGMTTLTNQRGYANGLITYEISNGATFYRSWSLSQEIPTYLACVAVSNYTHVNQSYPSVLQGINIPVQLIAQPGDTNNLKSSFTNLFGAMDAFENQYGPYLWDKVGFHLVPFSSGAMEHATSIAYPQVTANGTTAYETLMAHELSHHWWGNLVTCRTAEDMWINEGMASYSEKIFLEEVYGYNSYINEVKLNHRDVLLNAHIRDSGYFAVHGVPHSITYGDHSYNKGADVAHTLRSYMGDTEFFNGLHSFLNDNQFNDVDAYDFRDHLNTNTTVDVTDFFSDWIFNPGFPAFIIDSFTVVPNGSNYDISLFVHQKLKGTSQYFSNVPMEVTIMDSDWNKETSLINLNGEFSQVNLQSSILPEMIYFNEQNKISQAVTGENQIITTNGIKDLTFPLFRFSTTNSGVDSSLVRVEHYWVAPDGFKEPVNEWSYYISEERFWKVDGIFSSGYTANGRVFFNAKTNVGGNLDNILCGYPGFHEDSLRLLHRADAHEEWSEVATATVSNLGSKTDGYGYIEFTDLQKGEYTFGWRKSPVGIEVDAAQKSNFNIFPNPVKDWLTLESNVPIGKNMFWSIYDANGKQLISNRFTGSQINVSTLSRGSYLLVLDENGVVLTKENFIKE